MKTPPHPIFKEYLDNILLSMNNPTIIEIGSNELQDTQRLSDYFDVAKIYGFEPDPDFDFKQIKNVQLYRKAIGSFNGESVLYQSKLANGKNPGCSSIRKPANVTKEFSHVLFPNTVTVSVITLDSFVEEAEISHIDFIWADMQGAEIDMIKGGQNALSNTDYLFVEYSNNNLYDGQAKLQELCNSLPGEWEIIKDYLSDVFLKRKK